jgi:hypothetical protein
MLQRANGKVGSLCLIAHICAIKNFHGESVNSKQSKLTVHVLKGKDNIKKKPRGSETNVVIAYS